MGEDGGGGFIRQFYDWRHKLKFEYLDRDGKGDDKNSNDLYFMTESVTS